MRYKCPVCFYPNMENPPNDYHICPCCGTEFGNDDADVNHVTLRMKWMMDGMKWFFIQPPAGWNPNDQLSYEEIEFMDVFNKCLSNLKMKK